MNSISSLILIGLAVITVIGLSYYSYRTKSYIAAGLGLIQLAALICCAIISEKFTDNSPLIQFDNLSFIIIVLTGVLGLVLTLKSRFNLLLLISILAVDGLAVSNNILIMFVFWQIIAIGSFKLIVNDNPDGVECGKRMLVVNMIGGVFFLVGILVSALVFETFSISTIALLETRYADLTACVSIFLLLAAMARSMQMPFQGWYFHESKVSGETGAIIQTITLVNSGIILAIKMSPLMGISNFAGLLAIIGGGVTFFIASLNAITAGTFRRMLADSTSSIMGLVIICAGIGTSESLWAAVMLLIVHSAGKFIMLIGSEEKLLTPEIVIGAVVMMAAPFLLILLHKDAMSSIVDTGNIILVMIISFGGAISIFCWTRWLGTKITDTVITGIEPFKLKYMSPLRVAGWLLLAIVIAMPVISIYGVVPYISGVFGGMSSAASITDNIISTVVITAAVIFTAYPIYKGIEAKAYSTQDSEIEEGEAYQEETHEIIKKSRSTVRMQLICSIVSIMAIVLCLGFVIVNLIGLLGGAI